MSACIYPGSFDPVTKGHYDIICRAVELFDNVYVALLNNINKTYMFPIAVRLKMLRQLCKDMPMVKITQYDGLLVDLMRSLNVKNVLRAIRNQTDLNYEMSMADINSILYEGLETVVLLSKPELRYISSSVVRELILHNADISDFVPEEITDIFLGGTQL